MNKQTPPSNWNELTTMSARQLTYVGLASWDTNANGTLMLLPHAWHKHIPNGFMLESIMGEGPFPANMQASSDEEGYVDDDHRGGYLAYGFRVKP